ncbi:hypothetical protein Sjap_003535 [Stephania japonica]|uniref:Receptor-like serine/threonine-protein kinase n=1 Tax=Stephania japonica TaxID=461633 RepID=A0AAP0PV55_9MAGN
MNMMRRPRPTLFLFLHCCALLFLTISLKPLPCIAADTLQAGQSLIPNQTLISKQGNFALGFFNPGKSPNSYVGIWYNRVSVQSRTYVWVANRDNPIKNLPNSELKLLENGNLVLLDSSKTPVWETDSSDLRKPGSNSTKLVLGDDGNLVLSDGLDPNFTIWQSFDHPTDTWLPGGKIVYNNLTKTAQKLVSWKNSEDPSSGLFSLELKPDTKEYVIMWNRSVKFWSSGPWNGLIFSGVPEMRTSYIYNFSYESNVNESYFTYSVYNKLLTTRFVMDLSGQVKQISWLSATEEWNLFWVQPRQQCEVHSLCGPFGVCSELSLPFCRCMEGFTERSPRDWNLKDSSGGCVKETPLHCGDKRGFRQMSNVRLPKNSVSMAAASDESCKQACLSNCSCSAYTYGASGCSVWVGDLVNVQQLDGGGDGLYVTVAASDVSPSKKGSTSLPLILGIIAGVVVAVGSVLVLIWRCRVKRSVGTSKAVEGSLVAFTYRDLQVATKNFSERLGSGAFGSVFKGTLSDSTLIAVKKLEGITQGEKQFRTEVSTIGTIQHVNLVRLRGFCSEGSKRLLVYDYMPNRSLDSHLFYIDDSKAVLDWKTRYNIALGIARGLAYLHEECRDCIIHCDIKPENILLDADFCPKVADFGLAKLVGREFSRVLTTMRGTRGYLAPEWISGVAITTKADVYSYGMMLFEIISGRRNSERSENLNLGFFPTWAANRVAEGEEVLSILDYKLEGYANSEELTRAFRIACWCIQDNELHRPSMGQVVQILEGVLDVNPPPIPRSLQVLVDKEENINFFSESSKQTSESKPSSDSSQDDVEVLDVEVGGIRRDRGGSGRRGSGRNGRRGSDRNGSRRNSVADLVSGRIVGAARPAGSGGIGEGASGSDRARDGRWFSAAADPYLTMARGAARDVECRRASERDLSATRQADRSGGSGVSQWQNSGDWCTGGGSGQQSDRSRRWWVHGPGVSGVTQRVVFHTTKLSGTRLVKPEILSLGPEVESRSERPCGGDKVGLGTTPPVTSGASAGGGTRLSRGGERPIRMEYHRLVTSDAGGVRPRGASGPVVAWALG